MRKRFTVGLATLLMMGASSAALLAQPPGGRGQRGEGQRGEGQRGEGRGEEGRPAEGNRGGPGGGERMAIMMKMMPVFAALDADKNGEISTAEIENAVTALKALDQNKDGKLAGPELLPDMREMIGRMGGPEGGRGGEGGPGGRGGPGRDTGGASSVEATVKRMMEFDKNGDGKLEKDELPERAQAMLVRADTNNDGYVSKEEIIAMAEKGGGAAGGRGQEGGGRQQGGRPGQGEPGQRPGRPDGI